MSIKFKYSESNVDHSKNTFDTDAVRSTLVVAWLYLHKTFSLVVIQPINLLSLATVREEVVFLEFAFNGATDSDASWT